VFALLPVLLMVPVFAFTWYGFVQQSNLWPLPLIFAAPIAMGYLVILMVVRRLTIHPDKKEPCRSWLPVYIVVGLILAGGVSGYLMTAFTSEGGLSSTLINIIFPPLALILIGAIALALWAKDAHSSSPPGDPSQD
jgi:hypothetical protein